MVPEPEEANSSSRMEQVLSSYFGNDVPPIVRAAFNGDISSLKSLIQTPENMNIETDILSSSLLYFAIMGNQPEAVAILLSAGCDSSRPEENFGPYQEAYSLIDVASSFGHDAVLRVMMDHGIDVTSSTLVIAASLNRIKCAEVILEKVDGNKFSNATKSNDVGDALERACLCWHIESIELLLVHFMKLFEHDKVAKQTHLSRALGNAVFEFDCEHRCRTPDLYEGPIPDRLLKVLSLLFDHGADINFRSPEIQNCPFSVIVQPGNGRFPREIAYYFLDKGLQVNGKVIHNQTPMISYVVQQEAALDFVEVMIAKGADVTATDANMSTPLHQPICRATAELLVRSGADTTAKDNQGRKPLHIACQGQDWTLVEYLISVGADIQETATERKWTPLHFATCTDPDLHIYRSVIYQTVQVLLKHGANIHAAATDGTTAIHGAADFDPEDANVVSVLLNEGAQVDCTTENGNTPLHCACSVIVAEGLPTVHVLLDHGADLEARNHDGQTPLHLAIKALSSSRKNPSIVNLLLQKGANRLTEDVAGTKALDLIDYETWYFDDENLLKEIKVPVPTWWYSHGFRGNRGRSSRGRGGMQREG